MWPLLLAACLAAGAPTHLHVVSVKLRSTSVGTRTLLDQAAGSPVIAELLERLEATDQVVYLELTGSPDVPLARTMLVTSTDVVRFLRIDISLRVAPWDRLPLLAHELQHAVEIGEAPEARDENGLRRLYTRIGLPGGPDKFETAAARDVERRVRGEQARRR